MLVLAAAALLPLASASALPALFGLNTLASLRGRYVGTASEAVNIQNATAFGRAYGAIATGPEIGIFTNENNLKWEVRDILFPPLRRVGRHMFLSRR